MKRSWIVVLTLVFLGAVGTVSARPAKTLNLNGKKNGHYRSPHNPKKHGPASGSQPNVHNPHKNPKGPGSN